MAEHTPSPQAVEAFRAAWHEADAEGDTGNRTLRGLTAAGPIIAAEVRRAPDGCAWCCASNPPGVKPGSDHDICPAQRDRIAEHPCGDYPAPCNCDDPETHDGAVPAAEDDAVEKAARAWHEAAEAMDDEGPQMGPWDDLDPHDRDRARRYMRAALDAAGVSALRAEVERLREVSVAQPYETERELAVALDEARQQLADLRAGIEALAADWERRAPDRIVGQAVAADLRAMAGSGEQPGEVTHACPPPGDEGLTPCCGRTPFELPSTDRMTLDAELVTCHRPAPVVPDSTDVRGELLRVLDSHGIDTYIDGTGAEVGVQNLITDILAVVGQGVTADIPERLRRAVARLEEKRDGLRKPDMFERARLNGKIEGVKLASSYIAEGERIFRAAERPSEKEGS